MNSTEHLPPTPEQRRRLLIVRIIQSLGIVIGGAFLMLSYLRWPLIGSLAGISAAAAVLALVASAVVTSRARLAYYLFVAAALVSIMDLVAGYPHAMFFIGAFLVLGAVSAIYAPDEDEALTIERLMEEDGG